MGVAPNRNKNLSQHTNPYELNQFSTNPPQSNYVHHNHNAIQLGKGVTNIHPLKIGSNALSKGISKHSWLIDHKYDLELKYWINWYYNLKIRYLEEAGWIWTFSIQPRTGNLARWMSKLNANSTSLWVRHAWMLLKNSIIVSFYVHSQCIL